MYLLEDLADVAREALRLETQTRFGPWNLVGIAFAGVLMLLALLLSISMAMDPWPRLISAPVVAVLVVCGVAVVFCWSAWLVYRICLNEAAQGRTQVGRGSMDRE